MNKKFLSIVLIAFLSSCATIYKAPELTERTQKHQRIAFVPFKTVIQYKKLPKNTTVEQIKEMEKDMGYIFQEQMYTRFLTKQKQFRIELLDVSQTNTRLKKNNISYTNLDSYTKAELAQILKVDAIVVGKILTSRPMTTGGAIALGLLTGYAGATNKVDANISLYDGIDDKLLFKYDHTFSGGIGSSPESLSKQMMKHIARKFPYKN